MEELQMWCGSEVLVTGNSAKPSVLPTIAAIESEYQHSLLLATIRKLSDDISDA